MNPYAPPSASPKQHRKSLAGERSPAEAAFDFILLPAILFCVILSFSAVFRVIDSDGQPVFRGGPLVVFSAFSLLAIVHWAFALRKVYCSWRDPFGKVLRYVSSFLLLIEGLAIASALLL